MHAHLKLSANRKLKLYHFSTSKFLTFSILSNREVSLLLGFAPGSLLLDSKPSGLPSYPDSNNLETPSTNFAQLHVCIIFHISVDYYVKYLKQYLKGL